MDTDPNPEVAGPPKAAPVDGVRLGIKHLLVWTALCGVYLTAMRWFGFLNDVPWIRDPYHISVVVPSFAGGAILGLPLIWWECRRNRRSFPRFPGEWLWLLLFLRLVLALAFATTAVSMLPEIYSGDTTAYTTMERTIICLDLLICVVGACCVRQPRRWRTFMWLWLLPIAYLTVMKFAPIAWSLPHTWSVVLDYGFAYGLPIIALMMGIYDWRTKAPWPWTHWVGIGIVVWEIPAQVVAACVWHWPREGG